MRAHEPVLRCPEEEPHPYQGDGRIRCERWLWHKGPHMAETADPRPDGGPGLFMWQEADPETGIPPGVHAAMFYGKTLRTAPRRMSGSEGG